MPTANQWQALKERMSRDPKLRQKVLTRQRKCQRRKRALERVAATVQEILNGESPASRRKEA